MYSACRVNVSELYKILAFRRHYSVGPRFSFGHYDGPIVISGISGRFPKAGNTAELTKKLLAGEELTSETTERWDDRTLSPRFGFLQDLERFDANFFNLPQRHANCTDPQIRLLLEVAFEAIIDAGMNPTNLRGSRTGVFCGAYGEESHDLSIARINREERGYVVATGTQYMIPGRIAFHLDLRGPSTKVCTACSSSFTALEAAFLSIQCGKCDAAIVTASNVHLSNFVQKNLMAMHALAPDGRRKAFDESADGFTRSEAAVAILVQKEENAQRSYVRIRNITSNTDGFKSTGITHPDRHSIASVIKDCYTECGIDPSQVSYIEAHGTGTPAGDPEEFHALHSVFCRGPTVRQKPLLVGSVKTNLGHTECAAGLCGLAKVIGAIQTGILPGNLFFNKPNPEIVPLLDGTVEILTQPTPFDRGIVGICSNGIGGTNCHVILEPGRINECKRENQLPVVVPFSGRSEAQVESSIAQALENVSNSEYVYLLQAAFQRNIPGHNYKGYGLILPNDNNGGTSPENASGRISVERCDVERPVWVVFPGMGAQWSGMGQDLMRIEPFAHSVNNSRVILGQLGVDIDQLLITDNRSIFNNIHHAFLSISVMQIALWDTMCAMEIRADGFIGHSAGEGLCAYGDGCLSAEETLLLADARGRAIRDHQKVVGGMAAVGASAKTIRPRLPPGVQIACENSPQNITLSGERELVTQFAKQLKAEGIFTAEVNSCRTALHSEHVVEAADYLKTELKKLIKDDDRARGSRWISTSVPEAEWDSAVAGFDLAEYFANNLAQPVLFKQAISKIPAPSLVIEVSPKGFFQSILRESLPADCVNVAPMTVKAKDKLVHFFDSVGKMFTCGANLRIEKLYPSVSLPVSSNTPTISPLVQWDHSVSWKTGIWPLPADLTFESVVSLDYPEYGHLAGHKIDNRILMPATGYLHNIWMQFAENFGRDYRKFPVQFHDVAFKRATVLRRDMQTKVTYFLHSSSGLFRIESGGDIVATGKIERLTDGAEEFDYYLHSASVSSSSSPLTKEDFYKELGLRGYNYSGDFQAIQAADMEGKWADIAWKDNWTCFLDAVLQSTVLETTSRSLAVPVGIECIKIHPFKLQSHLQSEKCFTQGANKILRAVTLGNQNIITAPGVIVKGLSTEIMPQMRVTENLAYESCSFVPFFQAAASASSDVPEAALLAELIELVFENTDGAVLEISDVLVHADNCLAQEYRQIFSTKPIHETNITMITLASEAKKIAEKFTTDSNSMVVKDSSEQLVPEIGRDLVFLDDLKLLPAVCESVKKGGFVLVQSSSTINPTELQHVCTTTAVSQKKVGRKTLTLFRKLKPEAKTIIQVSVDKEEFQWLPELQRAIDHAKDDTCRIYVTSQGNAESGILGLTKCLRREEIGSRIRCIFDPEGKLNLDFHKPDARLRSIISQDLVVNVLYGGQPGSYIYAQMSNMKPGNNDASASLDAYVGALTPGDLSSLRWIELPPQKLTPRCADNNTPLDSQTYVVSYAALNFRDVLLATRTIPLEPNCSYKGQYMGYEFSGFDEKGVRVMGPAPGCGLGTKILSPANFVTRVPDHWTLEQAATVPIVYYTALYALLMRAHIQAGQSVLVHAGSGGVGQAAISVALAHGCHVFTTVGTFEKRELIKRRFPQILDDHIGNSRDTSFEAQFMEVTNGRGVDVILNSLAGEKLKASIRCLAMHGKFLEIGVADAYMNTELRMRPFLKNIDFSAIELLQVLRCPQYFQAPLTKLLEDGIRNGSVQPLPTHVFDQDQVEEAFRFMAKGLHAGKLLIKIRDSLSDPVRIRASRRTYFSKDKTYLVVGGLGGLGLEVANWMVERGAGKIVLTSRSGVTNGYQLYCLEKWRKAGAVVEILTGDLSDRRVAEEFMLKSVSSGENIGGIINSAVVLRDYPFPNQTPETFKEVSAPKADLTRILDELSRKYCPQLDMFVVFSSFSCGRGNPDQANYGWANSVMERICEKRKADGLHGLAIQWGLVGKVGVIAEKIFKGKSDANLSGTTFQSIGSCLEVLDNAILQRSSSVVSSGVIADKRKGKGKGSELMLRLQKIFGIANIQAVDPQRKLNELGMDSIVAVELKQTLEREYEVCIKKAQLSLLKVGDLRAIGDGTFDVNSLGDTPYLGHNDDIEGLFQLHDNILVRLKTQPTKRQVFIVHGAEGGSNILRPLAAKLLANVHAFQVAQELEWNSIPDLAAHYVKELKKIQPIGPYTILGYSAGCAIAFQMAQTLELEGNAVQHLVFLDGSSSFAAHNRTYLLEAIKAMNMIDKIPEDRIKAFAAQKTGDGKDDFAQAFELVNDGLKIGKVQAKVYKKLFSELGKHVPHGTFNGNVHVLETMNSASAPPLSQSTGKFCAGVVTSYKIRGDHKTFLNETLVEESVRVGEE